jgi:hypothetical protein
MKISNMREKSQKHLECWNFIYETKSYIHDVEKNVDGRFIYCDHIDDMCLDIGGRGSTWYITLNGEAVRREPAGFL